MNEDNLRTRTAAVSGTGRTSFRFDAQTWAAIDLVAEQAAMSWVEWAAQAIEDRPHATSKAAAVRAALADALMANQFTSMAGEAAAGQQLLGDDHPIVGAGYYRLDDKTLALELDGAQVVTRDDSFEGFTLLIGHRAKSSGGNAFVCIENRLREGLHLFIVQEDEE